jgi:hypothetical protein
VGESNSADGKTSRPEKSTLSREFVELAALFLAVGAADLFANTLADHRIRPLVLFGHGVLLIGCAALHRWWKHLPAAALAGPGVNIVSVQVHVLPRGAVEEFLVETPAEADLHDLVDVPTRVLTCAALAAATGGGLSRALRALPGECAIGWQEADEVHRGAGLEEGLEGTTIRPCETAGGLLTLERPALPFTPAEFARARALLQLEHRIAGRVAAQRAVILLTNGAELAIHQGVRADAARVAAHVPAVLSGVAQTAFHPTRAPAEQGARAHFPCRGPGG